MKAVSCIPVALLLLGCGGKTEVVPAPVPLSVIDSVGVEFGDSLYTFGAIIGLEFLRDGSFAVLDRAAGSIRVYSAAGEFIRRISSPGNGPGETVQAFGMLVFPDGGFGVMDPNQGGLMRFDSSGGYLGIEFEAFHNIPMGMVMVGDSGYVASRTSVYEEDGSAFIETFIGYFPLTWEPEYRYLSTVEGLDEETVGTFLMQTMLQCPWAVDPVSGTVYAAPYHSGEFFIEVLPMDHSVQPSRITLDLPVIAKTRAEIEAEREYYAALFTVMEGGEPPYNKYCEPFPNHHPVRALAVDDAGRLWVLGTGTPGAHFYVFSGSGGLLSEYSLAGVPSDEYLQFRVHGDRMLVYSEDPVDYQKIWLVEIPRGEGSAD